MIKFFKIGLLISFMNCTALFAMPCDLIHEHERIFTDDYPDSSVILKVGPSSNTITYKNTTYPISMSCNGHALSVSWYSPQHANHLEGSVVLSEKWMVYNGIVGEIDGAKPSFAILRTWHGGGGH